jgi:hypothetical protein
MAFTDNSATYSGKNAQDFYSKAILGANTIKNVRVIPNVKGQYNLGRLDVTGLLQAADCSFADGGTTTLAQRSVTVCDIKINSVFCTKDFESMYLSEQLRPGAQNNEIPGTFQDYLLKQMGIYVSSQVEQVIWNGDTAGSPASVCDGWLKAWTSDSNVVDVNGTTLSASNIIVEMLKLYNAIPFTILHGGNVKLYLSNAAASFYLQATAAAATGSGAYYLGTSDAQKFLGLDIVVCPGLPTNQMAAFEMNNVIFATDLESDILSLQILDMYKTLGEPNIRIVGGFKMGTSYQVGEEVVWYH